MNAASGMGANHCHSDWRADRSIGKKERQRDERWGGKDGEHAKESSGLACAGGPATHTLASVFGGTPALIS